MNNTEINTRLGWYSSSVTGSTADLSTEQQDKAEQKADGGWNEATLLDHPGNGLLRSCGGSR